MRNWSTSDNLGALPLLGSNPEFIVSGVKTYSSNAGVADEHLNVVYAKKVFRTLMSLIYLLDA